MRKAPHLREEEAGQPEGGRRPALQPPSEEGGALQHVCHVGPQGLEAGEAAAKPEGRDLGKWRQRHGEGEDSGWVGE